jgi:hypothetical protein
MHYTRYGINWTHYNWTHYNWTHLVVGVEGPGAEVLTNVARAP